MFAKNRILHPVIALFCSILCGTAAQASAPQQKTQSPGYFRMMLGHCLADRGTHTRTHCIQCDK
jgi:hypothetical protein